MRVAPLGNGSEERAECSTKERTRSVCCAAIATAVGPPAGTPTTARIRSNPRWEHSAAVVAAKSAGPGPAASEVRPYPGRDGNPAERADPPSQSTVNRARREMRTWTAGQLRRFLDHVRSDRLAAGWIVAATTGVRRGEVLGQRWEDVDLTAARLAARQTLVMVDGRPRLSLPKTPRSRRTIDLDGRTVNALRRWRERQEDDRGRWDDAWCASGLVLTREDGSWVGPDGWSAGFDRHVLAAGLPRIRLHDLRHTHATLLLASGTPPKVVSERLGHTTIAFTLDTYAHVVPGMQAEAANRFAALLFDGPSHEFRDQSVINEEDRST